MIMSYWFRVGPKSSDGYSYKKSMVRHIQGGDLVKTETKIEMMQLQAQECQGLAVTTRNWERNLG